MLKIGQIINIELITYDYNGEVWRHREIAVVINETNKKYILYTQFGQTVDINKQHQYNFEILT